MGRTETRCPLTDGERHPAETGAGGNSGEQPGAVQVVVHRGQSA